MTRIAWIRLGAAAVAGVAGYRIVTARRHRRPIGPGRVHAITVLRPLDDVVAGLPEELTGRGGVEVRLEAAPGDRGTVIRARSADGVPDAEVRRRLRTARSLLEVGYVLQPGTPTTTPTLLNRPLRAVTRRGRQEGLL
jgi:hypothetical protein